VLSTSVLATIVAVVLACFARRKLHANCGRLFNIFLATVDFVTDNAFMLQLYREQQMTFFIASSITIATALISSLTLIIYLLYKSWLAERRAAGSADLDLHELGRYAMPFAGILLLANTNLNLLVLLPWRRTLYDGFPTAKIFRYSQVSVLVEDFPQARLKLTHAHPLMNRVCLFV
jgi:hypothetical protein